MARGSRSSQSSVYRPLAATVAAVMSAPVAVQSDCMVSLLIDAPPAAASISRGDLSWLAGNTLPGRPMDTSISRIIETLLTAMDGVT